MTKSFAWIICVIKSLRDTGVLTIQMKILLYSDEIRCEYIFFICLNGIFNVANKQIEIRYGKEVALINSLKNSRRAN